MKVYELMNELAKYPSGAEVKCSATLTVPDLENGENCGADEFGDTLYSVFYNLDCVNGEDNRRYRCDREKAAFKRGRRKGYRKENTYADRCCSC